MSEKKTDKPEQIEVEKTAAESKPNDSKAVETKATASKAADKKPTASKAAEPKTHKQSHAPSRGMLPIYLAVLVVIVLLAAALWYMQEMQKEFKSQFEQQLQTQLSSSEQSSQELQKLSQNLDRSQSQLKQANDKIAVLEEQVHDLSQALQTMTDSGSELMLLNDVAHFIDLAQQQLLVGGNVRNAIIPLETAQARLVRSDRQSLALLLQAINGDLDRLRAVDKVDTADTLKQLETLLTWLTEAPLLAPQEHELEVLQSQNDKAPVRRESTSKNEDQEWWEEGLDVAQNWAQQAWTTMRSELAQLITVRRVDDATVLLMTPEQVQGLREHIRLRVSMAQLALMTRQNDIWQMELDTLVRLVEKRFDLGDAKTQRALGLLRELQKVDVQPKLPSLDNTLAAVESLRQKAAQQASAAEQRELTPLEPAIPVEEQPKSNQAQPTIDTDSEQTEAEQQTDESVQDLEQVRDAQTGSAEKADGQDEEQVDSSNEEN